MFAHQRFAGRFLQFVMGCIGVYSQHVMGDEPLLISTSPENAHNDAGCGFLDQEVVEGQVGDSGSIACLPLTPSNPTERVASL